VEFVPAGKTPTKGNNEYVFKREAVVPERTRANTSTQRQHEAVLEKKLEAIAQVLASFGLLDVLSKRKQEELLKSIYQILDASEK
jgi:aminopeptidase C